MLLPLAVLTTLAPHVRAQYARPATVAEVQRATALAAADIDGDGRDDLIAAQNSGLFWYPAAADGTYGPPQPIEEDGRRSVSLIVPADYDGDGDADLLVDGLDLAWLVNAGGGTFEDRRVVRDRDQSVDTVVERVDMDGDGDRDLVTNASRGIEWFARADDGTYGPARELLAPVSGRDVAALVVEDVDGDGDLDVLFTLAAFGDNSLNWLENTGEAFRWAELADDFAATVLRFVDLDQDGDRDLLSGDDQSLVWHVVTDPMDYAITVALPGTGDCLAVTALDADEHPDLANCGGSRIHVLYNPGSASPYTTSVAAEGAGTATALALLRTPADVPSGIAGLFNQSLLQGRLVLFDAVGDPAYRLPHVIFEDEFDRTLHVDAVAAADFDGDGLDDLVSSHSFDGTDETVWLRSRGDGTFAAPMTVDGYRGYLEAADLDGDGAPDLVTSEGWYAGRGDGTFAARRPFGEQEMNTFTVADFDGDGDLDLFGERTNLTVFYRNQGDGTFARADTDPADLSPLRSAAHADLDADGDPDVVLAAPRALLWVENRGASFEDDAVLLTGMPLLFGMATGDVDGDGRADVVTWTDDERLLAYRNLGETAFDVDSVTVLSGEAPVPGAQAARAALIVDDLDADGRDDVLAPFGGGLSVHYGPEATAVLSAETAEAVTLGDVDADGDRDVLAATERGLVLYENVRGAPSTAAPPTAPLPASRLAPGYPNPFRHATRLPFVLAGPAAVRIDIFDLLGRRVRVLRARPTSAGRHHLVWNGRDATGVPVADGAYLYRLHVDGRHHGARLVTRVR